MARCQLAWLLAITLAGGVLRVAYQAGRSFGGDEAGILLFLPLSYAELLTTFREPWLSMQVYMALIKALAALSASNAWVMVLPSLLAGVASIPLTAAVAVRLATPRIALAAAALVAANPYLVSYSVQLRSYMILVAFSLLSLVFFLDWRRSGAWRDGWGCALAGAAAVVMHAGAMQFALFLAVLFAAHIARDDRSWGARLRAAATLAGPVAASALLVLAVYTPLLPAIRAYHGRWSGSAPSSLAYVPWVVGAWLGRGGLALPSLGLLAVGLGRSLRHDRALAALALAAAVPMAAMSLAGVIHYPWGFARYLVASLPLLLILVAAGTDALPGRWKASGSALLAALVIASWWPALHEEFADKARYPWQDVAAYLRGELRRGDALLSTDERQIYPETSLTPILGVERTPFRSLEGFLHPKWSTSGEAPRLIVLNPHAAISTDRPQRAFGSIQIVLYEGASRPELVAALLDDLERSTGGRIDPDLAGQYRLLRNGSRLVRGGADDAHLSELYFESARRTERARFVPPEFLERDQR